MLNTIRVHILTPLLTRLGTATATALLPLGVHASLAQQVGIGVTAVGLVMFDLTAAYLNRKALERHAVNKAIGAETR